MEQTTFVEAVFRDVQRKHFSVDLSGSVGQPMTSTVTVGKVAALCSAVLNRRLNLEALVTEWLCKSQGGSITTLGLRRALLAIYSNRIGKSCYMDPIETRLIIAIDVLSPVLHRSLEQFGDKFSIKHVPSPVQNGQSILSSSFLIDQLLKFSQPMHK